MSGSKDISRRRFLSRMAQAGVAASSLLLRSSVFGQSQAPAPPQNLRIGGAPPPGGTKSVLTAADFTYLGSFRMPDTAGGQSTENSFPLTLRYVGGQLRFLGRTRQQGDQGVYEVSFPGLSKSNPPIASVARYWGNIYGDKMVIDDQSPGGPTIVNGLYWDETDERLYWGYGCNYSTAGTSPTIGYSTLNESTRVATAVGAYYVGSAFWKHVVGGVLAIPSSWAAQYTGGKRLGAGFGGHFSGQGASLGPTLYAFAPPSGAHRSTMTSTTLVAFAGVSQAEGTRPQRCYRNTDYRAEFSPPWNPSGNPLHGWWQWNDAMAQSGVWIDTGTKHGVLYGCRQGHGRLWYQSSDQWAESGSDAWFIINPADLARAAQGSLAADLVVPTEYQVQYPEESYPIGGWSGLATSNAPAFAFDATNNRLYVGRPVGWMSGMSAHMLVHCYQVS